MSSTHQPAAKQTPRKRVVVPNPNPNPKPITAAAAKHNTATSVTSSTSNPAAAKHNTATSVTSSTSNPAAAQPPSSSTTALQPPSSSTTALQPPSSSTTALQPPSSSTTALQPPSSSTTALQPPSNEWGVCSWAVKATPVEAILPANIPYLFCKMLDETADVIPMDDIYAQMPCQLVMNRRFNLPQDQSHLIYSKRHVKKNGTVQRAILNSSASWLGRGKKKPIAGKKGELVGSMTPLVLSCKNKKGSWIADEYVSVNNKDSQSSMVVLKCLNESWNDVETKLVLAEGKLADCYQSRLVAIESRVEARIKHWEVAVSFYQKQVATALERLLSERSKLREEEENRLSESVVKSPVVSVPSRGAGVRIQEPNIPVATLVVGDEIGAAPVVVADDYDGRERDLIDILVERRAAPRAREKGKGKV